MCSSIRHWAEDGKTAPKLLIYVTSPEGHMDVDFEQPELSQDVRQS
jgi:hypothetical protein